MGRPSVAYQELTQAVYLRGQQTGGMGSILPLLRDFLGPYPCLNESAGLIDVTRSHVLKDIKDKPTFKEVLAGGMRIAPGVTDETFVKAPYSRDSHLSQGLYRRLFNTAPDSCE
jgi:hypothetical protein